QRSGTPVGQCGNSAGHNRIPSAHDGGHSVAARHGIVHAEAAPLALTHAPERGRPIARHGDLPADRATSDSAAITARHTTHLAAFGVAIDAGLQTPLRQACSETLCGARHRTRATQWPATD